MMDVPFQKTGLAEIVNGRAASIGVDPREVSGHSIRRGFMTSAKTDLKVFN